jgi:hypothetical protein
MDFLSWFRGWRFHRTTSKSRARPQWTSRPSLEQFVSRLAPASYSWTGGAGTLNWADANNWSGGVVPGSSDNATINVAVSGPIAITGTQSINSLTDTTASLVLSSGSFTRAASSSVSQNFTVSGGTLTTNGGLTVNAATFAFNGGSIGDFFDSVLPTLFSASALHPSENLICSPE